MNERQKVVVARRRRAAHSAGGEWMGHHVEGETIYIGKMPRHTVKFMDGWLFIAYSSQEMAAGLAFSCGGAAVRRQLSNRASQVESKPVNHTAAP